MDLNISKVKFSNSDIKRSINIPKKLTPELCEIIGILAGDGCIYKRKNRYEIYIDGDSREDLQYHENIITGLFKNIFNLKIKTYKIKNKNAIRTRIDSKAIFTFLNKCIGIPYGKKSKNLIIPNCIYYNKKFIYNYLRGLADTDFYLKFKKIKGIKKNKRHYYPLIIGNSSSIKFIKKLHLLLKKIDLSNYIHNRRTYLKTTKKFYRGYSINILGKKNLEIWMKNIGFNNRRHLTKYLLWKKLGYYIPRTTLQERENLLNSNSKDLI